jgi:sulfate permease, SulP family
MISNTKSISDGPVPAPALWHLFVPKLVTAFREGYGVADARADLFAGLTVSVVALPLSLALAIASGVEPGRGLFTAVVAGLVVSALGGSRFQIAGPTGAFVVVVAGIVQKFGYEGLVVATLMAGLLLIATGLARLGTYIKYVPFPVVTGFTSGIAIVIFASQIGDILGLSLQHVPADMSGKLMAYARGIGSFNIFALAIFAGSLAIILLMQRLGRRLPSFLIAIAIASIAVWSFKIPVATIGTRFGGIPSSLPAAHISLVHLDTLRTLIPAAFTIFALGGIESLLSAVVADGMTGRRHRANCELVAQGFANIASAIMGGIPATGAIARTATNIRAGARSPMAGIVHSLAIFAMMALFAPLGSSIPLASLAAVLAVVCWNMADIRVFGSVLRASPGDRAVLVVTFLLTVFVDLSIAIAAGIILAALVFAHDMARVAGARVLLPEVAGDVDEFAEPNRDALARTNLPSGIETFRLSGPFFFAAAQEFEQILLRSGGYPKVLILRMAGVPLIDATGAEALKRFVKTAAAKGTRVILCELRPEPAATLREMASGAPQAANFSDALAVATRT